VEISTKPHKRGGGFQEKKKKKRKRKPQNPRPHKKRRNATPLDDVGGEETLPEGKKTPEEPRLKKHKNRPCLDTLAATQV